MIIKHDEAAGLIVHWPKADFIRYPPTSGPAAFLTSRLRIETRVERREKSFVVQNVKGFCRTSFAVLPQSRISRCLPTYLPTYPFLLSTTDGGLAFSPPFDRLSARAGWVLVACHFDSGLVRRGGCKLVVEYMGLY